MMNIRSIARLCCLSMLLCLLPGCEPPTPAQQREQVLAKSEDEIVIAVAWPFQSAKAALLDGVRLAVDEVNASGGLLGGRKIRLLLKDDESSLTRGRLVAQEIANDLQVSAVIGHLNTYIAQPAAQIYERAGLVFITPGASGQKITESGNRLVFRSLPGNREQGRQIGDYAQAKGYKNIALYYIKNDYGVDLANYFEQRANELGIHIVDRRSYNKEGDNHQAIFTDWAAFLKFDAVFFAGSLPEGPQIIRDMRASGIKVPVFGGVGLDSPEAMKAGGPDVEGTVVFSLYNADNPRPDVQAFNTRFLKVAGRKADSHAAQGYDTARLLMHAIAKANSRSPEKIAQALRSTQNWQGVTGTHSFTDKGDLSGKRLAQATVNANGFVFAGEAVK